jgi:hypothetical protein
MEKYFGVSYPTIKNRLNRIGALLSFVEIDAVDRPQRPSTSELLTQLESGQTSVKDVLSQLQNTSEGDA